MCVRVCVWRERCTLYCCIVLKKILATAARCIHRQIKRQKSRGLAGNSQSGEDDPFELFIGSTTIRWVYYKVQPSCCGFGLLLPIEDCGLG